MVDVPEGATSTYHQKAHLNVPSGFQKIVALVHWKSNRLWSIGVDIGTGICLHSGQLLASEEGSGKDELTQVTYQDSELQTGTWFVHFRFLDTDHHEGDSQTFNVFVMVIPYS